MSRKREPYPGFDWSWVPTPETPALLFDIETDGLLDETSTIHCICAKDFLTGESFSFGPGGIEDGLRLLSAAPLLVAHNGLCFDIPAIQKLHPSLLLPRLFDTLTASRSSGPTSRTSTSRSSARSPAAFRPNSRAATASTHGASGSAS